MIGMNSLGSRGRLGNQMFQYASLVGISKNMGYEHCIPDHSHVPWFHRYDVNNNITTFYHQLQHLFELNHLNGRFGLVDGYEVDVHQHEFCEELFNECPDNASLIGNFESYKYFENAELEVRKDFTFKGEILEDATSFHRKNNTDHPVCLNIRRGDFIKFQDHHPPCTEKYYLECIQLLGADRQYIVISDDIEWCKKVFTQNNFIFCDEENDEIKKGHLDLCIGSLCCDFIISNSTFSWWMSYLGSDLNKKVCIPDPWFGEKLSHLDTSGYYPPGAIIIKRDIIAV
jgi:hypothetical protein